MQALVAVLVALLVSCPTDSPSHQNRSPVVAFTSSQSAQTMTPLAFDASASSNPDGDALVFTWDFADGGRGGAAKIGHVFASAGSYRVTLIVADGRGGSNTLERTVVRLDHPSPAITCQNRQRPFPSGCAIITT